MSHRHASPLIAGAHVHGVGGLGIPGSLIPTTGEHGGSILANDVEPGDEAKEFRALILTRPTGGTIVFGEDGSFTASGFGVGTHAGTYEGFADGVSYGVGTYTLGVTQEVVAGSMATVESGADVVSIVGRVAVSGALSLVETGSDAVAIAGHTGALLQVAGSLAVVEAGADAASISGAVSGSPSVTGHLALVETGADSVSIVGYSSSGSRVLSAPPLGRRLSTRIR